MIIGTHDYGLVALSLVVAVVASYAALDLAGRRQTATAPLWSAVWLAAASVAMGGGIWSMHFVAMLAYSMPGMETSYDLGLTLLSFVFAVGVTGAGFAVVSSSATIGPLLGSGLLMGLGIVAMHYTGMAAMRMPVHMHYDPYWVIASIVIAVGASIAALWLAFRSTSSRFQAGAAIAMGAAISGMHYSGMQAVTFADAGHASHVHAGAAFNQANLALTVSAITLFILSLALIAAMFDRRLVQMAEREAAALRLSEDLFKSLYRRTPLPLHALDTAGRLQEVSDAWLALLGYSRDEVLGRPLASFISETSAEDLTSQNWLPLLSDGSTLTRECELLSRTNDAISVVLTARLARELNNPSYAVIGGLIDLTERKKAELALVQSQKMEAIGQLTGGVAHDFNNLLAVVLGNLELLRKRLPAEPQITKLIDNASEGAKRGASLTQRMLSFARRQDMRVKPVDVSELVHGMMELLQSSAGSHIRITLQVAGDRPIWAMVDPQQLELALLNLVVNARDAMPGGGTLPSQ